MSNRKGEAHRFELSEISCEELGNEFHLVGKWFYLQTIENQNPSGRIRIEGSKTPDGIFWPDVSLEVRNEATGKWEKIAEHHPLGQRTKIIVEPNTVMWNLTVNLKPFHPLIGKYKLGRIVLKTGETSQFALDGLTREGEKIERAH